MDKGLWQRHPQLQSKGMERKAMFELVICKSRKKERKKESQACVGSNSSYPDLTQTNSKFYDGWGGATNGKITMSCHFIKTTSRRSSRESEVRRIKFSWHCRGLGEARPRAGRRLVVALSQVVVCRNLSSLSRLAPG